MAFFASTILVVVWYKFVPVWITPLMIIRGVEQVSEGHMPKIHHSWMALDNMPKEMPVAVMASEDQRFLIHHGFDFDAIQKAIKRNKKAGVKIWCEYHKPADSQERIPVAWKVVAEKGHGDVFHHPDRVYMG